MGRLMTSVAGSVALMLILLGMATCTSLALAAEPEPDPEPEAVAAMAEAREALNKAEYERAADLFEQSRERSRQRELRDKARYWEAFSRYRLQRTDELHRAAELLVQLELQEARLSGRNLPPLELKLARESEALAARVNAELARRGELGPARLVHEQAQAEQLQMQTRVAALQALLEMDPVRAEPMLEKILRDDSVENQELRLHTVMLGCQRDSDRMRVLLLELLESEDDPEFVSTVVMCLSMDPSPEVMDKLMELFQRNPDPEVAEAILLSVARQGGEGGDKAFNFLSDIALDQNADVEMRQSALMALGMADGGERTTDLLVDILKQEDDSELLESALISLARLDNAAADEALRDMAIQPGRDEAFRAQALHAASMHGRLTVDFLREVYAKAVTGDMKLQVCHILTRVDDRDAALDALLEFARAEQDLEIKQQMVFWIGRFDDPRAADYLLEILNGE